MRLFAIGDLHMPGGDNKPMDVFGAHWENHLEKIAADWRKRVAPEDLVLIPGDISWAMQLKAAAVDLAWIGDLPGQKLLIKGNHDYWWTSLTQIRSVLPANMQVLQVSALEMENCVVCGSRGWMFSTKESALSP